MTIFHQVLGCVGKRNVGIQIASLLGESFDPTICREAVVVASVADYKGSFMDRGIVGFHHLFEVFVREVSLDPLGRSLITCFEDVDAFCKHRVI